MDGVEPARQDAALRTGIPAAKWSVALDEDVTWNDGSLGIPEPGMMYTMAQVPGRRIVLRHRAQRLEYHTGAGQVKFAGVERTTKPSRPRA